MANQPSCYLCGSNRISFAAANPEYSFARCERCGLRRQDPMPDPDRLRGLYHGDYYQDRGLDKSIDLQPKFMRELIADRVGALTRFREAPGSLLDVGCGTGLFLEAAQRAGWEAVGLEVSEASLAYATKFTAAQVLQGRLADLPSSPTYDAVTFWDVLEHLPDPRGELVRVYSLLKPGGVVGISLPNVGGLKARILGNRWRYYQPSMGHVFHFSPRTLSRLLGQAGFQIIDIGTHGAFNLWKILGEDPLSVRESRPLLDRVQTLADYSAGLMRLGETITAWARRQTS